MDAQNEQHAKTLAEQDVLDMEDTEKVQAQGAILTATGVGYENGVPLDRYDVTVRFRRNLVVDAEDNADARYWAEQDQATWEDTEPGSFQAQVVTLMQEKTGTT